MKLLLPRLTLSLLLTTGLPAVLLAQKKTPPKANDSTTPLHALQPDYPVPYDAPKPAQVKAVLDRVFAYLDANTPAQLIDKTTEKPITDLSRLTDASVRANAIIKPGDFRLTSYEWGVTYAGMLLAGEATGDPRYTQYTHSRLQFLTSLRTPFLAQAQTEGAPLDRSLRQMLAPHALDDAGAMCAALIKASRAGGVGTEQARPNAARPQIDAYMDYIMNKEFRLADGTLARNRPLPRTLWLDDLFMSVPAIAQMGKLTGETRYYDEAVKQVTLFSGRMFNPQKGLYMHGWVEGMSAHPEFHWARANGWAILTKIELLDVLPENHPGRAALLDLLRAHVRGLTAQQSGSGFWHQLLDRHDSYLETSATAIYAYCLARAINRGWIDARAYSPAALLAWNAVATKVNAQGQVEGTCVGTGMAFDPAFYYHRPINVYAAHGYGPVLLAGAEIINLLKNQSFIINDSALMMK